MEKIAASVYRSSATAKTRRGTARAPHKCGSSSLDDVIEKQRGCSSPCTPYHRIEPRILSRDEKRAHESNLFQPVPPGTGGAGPKMYHQLRSPLSEETADPKPVCSLRNHKERPPLILLGNFNCLFDVAQRVGAECTKLGVHVHASTLKLPARKPK